MNRELFFFIEVLFLVNLLPAFGQQAASEWNGQGVGLLAKGSYDEAIQDFNIAIGLNSSYAAAWYNKGLALDDLGKYEEAIQAYNRSIDLKPGLAEAWSNKVMRLIV